MISEEEKRAGCPVCGSSTGGCERMEGGWTDGYIRCTSLPGKQFRHPDEAKKALERKRNLPPEVVELRNQAAALRKRATEILKQVEVRANADADRAKRKAGKAQKEERLVRQGEAYWAQVRGESKKSIAKRTGVTSQTVEARTLAYKRHREAHYDRVFHQWLLKNVPDVATVQMQGWRIQEGVYQIAEQNLAALQKGIPTDAVP